MADFDWLAFMQNWRKELIASDEYPPFRDSTDPINFDRSWLGYEGASIEAIQVAEARLGIILPPSYKQFLLVTNGWRDTSSFVDKMWSVGEIDWFAMLSKEWVDGWINNPYGTIVVSDEDYFDYSETQHSVNFRQEYLETALQISEEGDGSVYLLNPKIINEEGEWEAWYFADWFPGAVRYPSFQDLMIGMYKQFLYERDHNISDVEE